LVDGTFFFCAGFEVEDVDGSVSDLNEVDVSGDHFIVFQGYGDLEAQLVFVVAEVVLGEEDGHFGRDGDRIVYEHELLEDFVSEFVVTDGLQDHGRGTRGDVFFPRDFDLFQIEVAFDF